MHGTVRGATPPREHDEEVEAPRVSGRMRPDDQTRDHRSRSTAPRSDPVAHKDGRLMLDVIAVNNELGRYVVRFIDADTGRVEPLSVVGELALADQVAAVADGLRARAIRRHCKGDPAPLIDPATSSRG
jgi:hypothetical protein